MVEQLLAGLDGKGPLGAHGMGNMGKPGILWGKSGGNRGFSAIFCTME